MGALLDLWPILLAAVSGLAVWISRYQVKIANQEKDRANTNLFIERKVRDSEKSQTQALKDGEVMANKIIGDANAPNSAGDLTNSDY